jgi:hypothetical protein
MKAYSSQGRLKVDVSLAQSNRFDTIYLLDRANGGYVAVGLTSEAGAYQLELGPKVTSPVGNYFDVLFLRDRSSGAYTSITMTSDGSGNFQLEYGTIAP